MKIVVLGAGVVGVATAYYLAKDGHEVALVDRRAQAAEEASFGNAGLYSPSDAYAWASPDALKMAVKSLYRSDLGIKYKIRLDPQLWWWSLKFLGQCTNAAARRNTLRKLQLLTHSKDCLNQIVAETAVDYDGLQRGILYFFRAPEMLAAAERHMSILRDQGVELQAVDRQRMVEIEPVLANAPEVAGAIYSPTCQTGNSHKFANGLADWCVANRNAALLYDTKVLGLVADGDRIVKAETDKGPLEADSFVLAAGSESPFIARSVGLRLPIYPVKGFSVTVPFKSPGRRFAMGLVDEDKLVAMSPFGDRLRAASSAVFTGYDYSHKPDDFEPIVSTLLPLFGDAIDLGKAIYWTGMRPMTPTSVPIMGASRYRNLYLNVGHGHVGWSMSCGAGHFLADCIAGRRTAVDATAYAFA